MTPQKRSTLQLDLKDLSASPAPRLKRLISVAAIGLGGLLGAYAIANTTLSDDPEEVSNIGTSFDTIYSVEETHINTSANTQDENQLSNIAGTTNLNEPAALLPADSTNNVSISILTNTNTNNSLDDSADLPFVTTEDTSGQSATLLAPQQPLNIEQDSANIVIASLESNAIARSNVLRYRHPAEPVVSKQEVVPAESLSRPESTLDVNQDVFTIQLEPDSIEKADELKSTMQEDLSRWQKITVKKNDTLSQIFNRASLSSQYAYAIARQKDAKPLLRIRPGDIIRLAATADGSFSELEYRLNKFNTLRVSAIEEGFNFETIKREPDVRVQSRTATIWSSLMAAAKESDIGSNTIYDMIKLFGWQVDFAKDIRSGDRFSVIFEELYLDDKKVGEGQILAAELISGNKSLRAIRHVYENGDVDYFAPDGDGIKGSFLRTPIKFGRVSSKFTHKRFHPILKKWRAHKGVDYSAPKGTPIFSTGDGVVRQASNRKGYGRTVVIRHGGQFETLYAHMNGFAKGIKAGARVKQGDVIGYVGRTGWATGPHLHYEFRVNGKHKNPLTVTLPKSSPIEKKLLPQFQQVANTLVAELKQLNEIPVAKAETTDAAGTTTQ